MRVSDAWSQDVVLKAMCDDTARQRKGGMSLDFILATDDLAFSEHVDEDKLVASFFDALVGAAGVPREHIFCIPGNHDIDRECQKMCFLGARNFAQGQNQIDVLLSSGDDLETLLKRQENYRNFQSSYSTGQERDKTADGLGYVSWLSIRQRVFTYAGKPLGSANTRAWRDALKRAGIRNFRWHDLRHTWASWHRQAGTSTHELQRLGGWRSSVMVERYAHLAPDHLAKAANRLDSLLGGYDLTTREKEKGAAEGANPL